MSKGDGRELGVLGIFLFCQSGARRQDPSRWQKHEREGGLESLMEKYGALTRNLTYFAVVTPA